MKRVALFVTIGSLSLLTVSCSKDDRTSGASSSGESGGAGGAGVSSNSDGTGARSGGSDGSSSATTKRDSAAGAGSGSGGSIGSTASATVPDVSASGGEPGSTGLSMGGGGGAATAKGGATRGGGAKGGAVGTGGALGIGGSGGSGKSGASGAVGTGGATHIVSSSTGSKVAVGGATGTGDAGIAGGPIDGGEAGSALSSGCGRVTALTSARASIDVSSKTREYILALPKNYDPNHPYKLVFAWHPWTGSAQQIATGGYYGLQKQANNEAIFVAAEGLNYTQGGQSGLGWGNANGEDIAFYHAMLDRFRSELCIDENRIFSVGFSFGAMFSFTLGCTSESMMRAIVPMAGNTTTSGGCENGTRSIAVMALIGLQDSLLNGHRQAVTTYTKRDGCTATTQTMSPSWCDGLSSTNLPCTCVSHTGCKEGYPVIACEYTAGHQQAPNPGPIWDFLAQF